MFKKTKLNPNYNRHCLITRNDRNKDVAVNFIIMCKFPKETSSPKTLQCLKLFSEKNMFIVSVILKVDYRLTIRLTRLPSPLKISFEIVFACRAISQAVIFSLPEVPIITAMSPCFTSISETSIRV